MRPLRSFLTISALLAGAVLAGPGCGPGDGDLDEAEVAAEATAVPARTIYEEVDLVDMLVAVLLGLVLAVAFQTILSLLSVAAGISMLGPLDEEEGDGKDGRKRNRNRGGLPTAEEVGEEAREITDAFGLWSLVTTALSLLFGTWLAISLLNLDDRTWLGDDRTWLGAILGLATWALFFPLLAALEASAISSAVGTLVKTAMSGFRSVASAATSMFEPSAEHRAHDMAEGMTKAVADVLQRDNDAQRLKRELRDYLRDLKPRPIEPGRIRREIGALLDDLEVHAVAGGDGRAIDVDAVVADLRSKGTLGSEDIESVRRGVSEALSVLADEAAEHKGGFETVADAAARLTGRSKRSAEAGRRKLEEYLRETDKAELSPEGIKRDLTRLITQPKAGAATLRARIARMDRETVRALLAARNDISDAEAERIVSDIEKTIRSIFDQAVGGRAEADRQIASVEGGAEAVRRRAEQKIRTYLNALDQPELHYEDVKDDIALLFHDPNAGAEALRDRWQAMDRETLRAVIASSRSDLDEDDAEALLSELERVRDEALAQADRLKAKAKRQLRKARHEALEQAEEVRKVAQEAAWWAFGTAAISGLAAVVGGALGGSDLFGDIVDDDPDRAAFATPNEPAERVEPDGGTTPERARDRTRRAAGGDGGGDGGEGPELDAEPNEPGTGKMRRPPEKANEPTIPEPAEGARGPADGPELTEDPEAPSGGGGPDGASADDEEPIPEDPDELLAPGPDGADRGGDASGADDGDGPDATVEPEPDAPGSI